MKESRVAEYLNNKRNIVKLILDIMAIILALGVAYALRYDSRIDYIVRNYKLNYLVPYTTLYLVMYIWYRMGSKSWGYTNSLDVIKIIIINGISLVGLNIYLVFSRVNYSRSVVFMFFVFSIIFQLIGRLPFRFYRSYKIRNKADKEKGKKARTMLYGAGEAGVSLLRENSANINFPYNIVAIIDDDNKKKGTYINEIKVVGNFEKLCDKLKEYEIELLLVAIPTLEKSKLEKIIGDVREKFGSDITIKILPRVDEIEATNTLEEHIRDVKIEDLLGREEVLVNGDKIGGLIFKKNILITGGAGSIGSELARQIIKYNPSQLVLVDVNESELYFLQLELKRKYDATKILVEVCNIRERDKVDFLFNKYNPQIVFHAAAHKHVPLMEYNPEEAVKNNLFGTRNVMEAADKYSVDRFVLISTDKAVNPTNVMGATKRGCELILEDINKKSKTKYMAVRFGNVLGSNGSVIPYFKNLLNEGKNLTVTHMDITRYFMTIPEAAQLVIEAGALGKGGEIFILDMGEPIKIYDLAKRMIKLSGANVDVEIVGLREGEKLYEELLYDVNSAKKTSNKKIFITEVEENSIDVNEYLEKLKKAVEIPEKENIKNILKEFITSYKEPEHHKK